jgi:hypothetical protein
MPVLFTRAELDKISQTLKGVRSVGQAWAAIEATQKLANTVADEVHQTLFEDAWRTEAIKTIRAKQATLTRESKALLGASATASASAAWAGGIQNAVSQLWFFALVVQQQFPANETTAAQRLSGKVSLAATSLKDAVLDAPDLVLRTAEKLATETGKQTKKVAKTIGQIVKTGLDTAGDVAAPIVSPFKWYVVGALGVLTLATAGYLYVRFKVL